MVKTRLISLRFRTLRRTLNRPSSPFQSSKVLVTQIKTFLKKEPMICLHYLFYPGKGQGSVDSLAKLSLLCPYQGNCPVSARQQKKDNGSYRIGC